MIYTELTRLAMKLACEAHQGQLDKSGLPYIHHPLHVAESMMSEETTAAALLHDVLEDTDVTAAQLLEAGIPAAVVEALQLLTHEEGVPYLEYVAKIGKNPIAKAVKLSDLTHNSDLSRLVQVTEKDLARVEKYRRAMALLSGCE